MLLFLPFMQLNAQIDVLMQDRTNLDGENPVNLTHLPDPQIRDTVRIYSRQHDCIAFRVKIGRHIEIDPAAIAAYVDDQIFQGDYELRTKIFYQYIEEDIVVFYPYCNGRLATERGIGKHELRQRAGILKALPRGGHAPASTIIH